MAGFDTFERDIRLATAAISPAAINAQLAAFARAELAGVIGRGEAPPIYDRYVNGRLGASEDDVEAPGPILYVFSWWRPVIGFALDYLAQRSPKGRSGQYSNSFIVLVNGREIAPSADIPAGAEVVITNRRPQTRKIEVGAMKMSVPPGIFRETRQRIFRRFGQNLLDVEVKFLLLPNPYILKRSQGNRKDRQAGMPLTYPSLVMNMRT